MLYLLDANVLIEAKNTYYEFGRVDQYWDWLVYQAFIGNLKIPIEIIEEINRKNDRLTDWARRHKEVLRLDEEVSIPLFRDVVSNGYASDLNEVEIGNLGRDPFLIAYVLSDVNNRTVVTSEVRSNSQRQNKRIPNVCDDLGVKWCTQFEFLRKLNFRIN